MNLKIVKLRNYFNNNENLYDINIKKNFNRSCPENTNYNFNKCNRNMKVIIIL